MFHYHFLLLSLVIGAMAACSPVTFAQSQYAGGQTGLAARVENSGVKLLTPRKKRDALDMLAPRAVVQDPLPHAAIVEALTRTVDCEFIDMPLVDAVDFVAEHLGYPVFIDEHSLDEVGLSVDEPVNLSVKNFQLEHLLTQMLYPFGITHMVIDGNVKITTLEKAESNLQTRVYPLGDLFSTSSASHDAVMALLVSVVAPDSWERTGGAGTMDSLSSTLVISQTYHVHQQVEHLLGVLRRLQEDTSSRKELPVFYGPDAAESKQAIRDALLRDVRLPESTFTLNEFAGFLSEATKANVLLDQQGLEEIGLDLEIDLAQLQSGLSSMTARHALDALGGELAWQIHAGAVVITSRPTIESFHDTRVYPVTQLISGIRTKSPENASDLVHLMEAIKSHVAPDSWDEVGGAGTIVPIMEPPAMVISQDERTHAQVARLLSTLKEIPRQKQNSMPSSSTRSRPRTLVTVVYQRPIPVNERVDAISAKELAETIQTVLGNKTSTRRRRLVQVVDDRVVVRQPAEKHQQIQGLLRQLYPYYGERGVGRSGGFF